MTIDLHELQHPAGAFEAWIHLKSGRVVQDHNSFVTGHVVRALGTGPLPRDVASARDRALDYLVGAQRRDAWGFWPSEAGLKPDWIPQPPLDSDDTALVVLELLRHGRMDERTALHIVCTRVLPARLARVVHPSPPWFRRGVFLTYIEEDGRPNVVDCCANANVLALLAYMDRTHLPGYAEAVEMIRAGLRWAGADLHRLQCLAPFYPDPDELRRAIREAVSCGVGELRGPLAELEDALSSYRPQGIACSSMYGSCKWTSPAVQLARDLRHEKAAWN